MAQPEIATTARPRAAWRRTGGQVSLPEVHRTILVPQTASFWRKLMAFSGPGFLVAVGYMDPGNWATDLAGGARFGYSLLCVIMISNLMAILLQHLCIKLGVATGRDLAQACRDHYPRPLVWFLWILCEIAIAACDLAEVVGSAIALQLLFGIPLVWGCLITALDVLAVLYLQNKGFRYVEALVITLIATIGTCFALELIFSKPSIVGVALGFIPGPHVVTNQEMLYVSIGILGATVMPHNLYLHSSIVQTRKFEQTPEGRREAIKFATIDSSAALMFALFINAAILILAAAAFHWSGHQDVGRDSGCVQVAQPVAGCWRSEHTVCRRVARVRAKLDSYRHACRPDSDGRFSQHPNYAVAASADHAAYSHRTRNRGDRCFRRRQNDGIADCQPGLFKHATRVRRVAANAIYRRKSQNG